MYSIEHAKSEYMTDEEYHFPAGLYDIVLVQNPAIETAHSIFIEHDGMYEEIFHATMKVGSMLLLSHLPDGNVGIFVDDTETLLAHIEPDHIYTIHVHSADGRIF